MYSLTGVPGANTASIITVVVRSGSPSHGPGAVRSVMIGAVGSALNDSDGSDDTVGSTVGSNDSDGSNDSVGSSVGGALLGLFVGKGTTIDMDDDIDTEKSTSNMER